MIIDIRAIIKGPARCPDCNFFGEPDENCSKNNGHWEITETCPGCKKVIAQYYAPGFKTFFFTSQLDSHS